MRKRNFINCFFTILPLLRSSLMVFLFFYFLSFRKRNRRFNPMQSAPLRRPRTIILWLWILPLPSMIFWRAIQGSLFPWEISFLMKANYLDVVLTNSILSNFTSLTNNAPYIASVYYYLDDYDSILTSDTGGIVKLSRFSDLSWKDSYDSSDKDQWLERRQMHQYSYAEPIPVLTYFKKLNMFRGVVMVNIYEEQLKQLITTSSQLDSFFILDQNGNFLLEAGKQNSLPMKIAAFLQISSPLFLCPLWRLVSFQQWFLLYSNDTSRLWYLYCRLYQLLQLLSRFLSAPAAVAHGAGCNGFCIPMDCLYHHTKNFQQIDYFVNLFSDAERGVFRQEKPDFLRDEYDLVLNNIVQLFLNQTFLKISWP